MSTQADEPGPDPRHTTDSGHVASPTVAAAYVAALEIAAETGLPSMLQRLVDLAREVIPSRYAALGVAEPDGRVVEFYTSGITPLERARIGPLPQGHGMIGVLMRDRRPLIVDDISADPRSVGFPPHHPPMQTLLGVPILLGDRVLGDLYLTERTGAPAYDQADLHAVQILAANAALAIERARLYERAEENRRRAEDERDQLQVILDHLPAAVIIRNAPGGDIELTNGMARRMMGDRGPGEMHFLRADGSPLPRRQWPGMRSLKGEVVRDRQLLLEDAAGQHLPVLIQSAPLRNRDGAVVRSVVVLQDITRLREAEQLKDDFLSLISHEFRTPLTAIHGGARLLAQRGETLDAATRKDLLADIAAESTRLEQMLANMLTLTAIRAGRLEPSTEPILVRSVVRQAIAVAELNAPTHHFTVSIPPELHPAEGDADLLGQVLRNLYENAVKYSPAGSTVATKVTFDADRVTISVTDEGAGIAPEHLATVFERFRRPGADPTVRGMGLGLYLSRHLVEAQGGTIGVTSPGPGRGATFFVTLPVAA